MKVSELAKAYDLTVQDILNQLKSLKLKAKDGKQELSPAVLAVLKSYFNKQGKKFLEKPVEKKSVDKKKAKLVKEKSTVKPIKKKAVKSEATLKKIKVSKEKVSPKTKSSTKTKVSTKTTTLAAKKSKTVKLDEKKKVVQPLKKETEAPKEEKKVDQSPEVVVEKIASVQPVNIAKRPILHTMKPIMRPKHHGHRSAIKQSPSHELDQKVDIVTGPPKEIEIDFPVAVKDLSFKLQQKPGILLKILMKKGVFATINQALDEDIINKISQDLNFTFTKAKTVEEQLFDLHHDEDEDPSLLKNRPPVITFMGHVDHGKTSLLDKIRKSHITDQEHGGITQHMAAYSVTVPKGTITFLDTPGHAAFTAMRARGAHITDLIILVVAADEGGMPQTEEAIDHAKAAGVPIVVAVNKIDKSNADIERVKKQLSERDLLPEDWGGKTIVVGVSATTGEKVDSLLEMILLEAELLELKANYDKPASGIVVEAHLSHGRGSVASVIIQRGTLKEGDIVVAGPYFGKIKAMFNDRQVPTNQASPSIPVEVLGLSGVPEAGEIFYVVEDEKKAKEVASKRLEQIKNKRLQASQKITLEDLYSQIQEGKIKELNIVLKADVQGSLEALKDSLNKLSTEEVAIKFLHSGIGHINAADVILAGVANAIIVGFHVDVDVKAKEELEKQEIDVRTYRIIYDAVDDIKKALSGLLEPRIKKIFLGRVDIRQVFKLSKSGMVAGCFVTKGRIPRKAKIVILRNGSEVFSGEIESLKRFKDDVKEVREGFECGITVKNFDQMQPGDVIEAYDFEKIERTL